MNAQQIIQVCLTELCLQDGIINPVFEDLADREAALILKLISEGDFHLGYHCYEFGDRSGQVSPTPVSNCNYIDNNSATYIELTAFWAAEDAK